LPDPVPSRIPPGLGLGPGRGPISAWVYGLAPVAATVLVRWLLEPVLEDKSPFLLFTFAVMLGAVLGGVRVGAAATALGAVAGILFLEESPAADVLRSGRALQLILYMSVCGAIVYLIDVLSRLRREAEAIAAEQGRLAEQLAEANRAKDQFLATVSHELRTPLTAIVGWAHLLKSGGLSQEKAAKALEIIDRNARIQAQLIADLLDVARITSGKLRIEPRETDAAAVVAAAVETVAPAARARGIELETDCDDGATLNADPDRLQQAIWNLLSNAVKFSPPHGRVRAALRVANDAVHITVSDTGPGLRPEFITHIFERFRQDGDGRRSAGLGLGLSIVKHIVEMHGGTVSGANRAPAPGAIFEIVLPRVLGTPAEGRPRTSLPPKAPPPRSRDGPDPHRRDQRLHDAHAGATGRRRLHPAIAEADRAGRVGGRDPRIGAPSSRLSCLYSRPPGVRGTGSRPRWASPTDAASTDRQIASRSAVVNPHLSSRAATYERTVGSRTAVLTSAMKEASASPPDTAGRRSRFPASERLAGSGGGQVGSDSFDFKLTVPYPDFLGDRSRWSSGHEGDPVCGGRPFPPRPLPRKGGPPAPVYLLLKILHPWGLSRGGAPRFCMELATTESSRMLWRRTSERGGEMAQMSPEANWDGRAREVVGMMMVGEGALAALEPVRHCRNWQGGPRRWRRLISFFVERPALTRAIGLAEIGAGLWLAARQRP
jgi:signal transduction histidine kinase